MRETQCRASPSPEAELLAGLWLYYNYHPAPPNPPRRQSRKTAWRPFEHRLKNSSKIRLKMTYFSPQKIPQFFHFFPTFFHACSFPFHTISLCRKKSFPRAGKTARFRHRKHTPGTVRNLPDSSHRIFRSPVYPERASVLPSEGWDEARTSCPAPLFSSFNKSFSISAFVILNSENAPTCCFFDGTAGTPGHSFIFQRVIRHFFFPVLSRCPVLLRDADIFQRHTVQKVSRCPVYKNVTGQIFSFPTY